MLGGRDKAVKQRSRRHPLGKGHRDHQRLVEIKYLQNLDPGEDQQKAGQHDEAQDQNVTQDFLHASPRAIS